MKGGDPAAATEILGRAAGSRTSGNGAVPGRSRGLSAPVADRPYTVRLARPLNAYAPDEARANAEQLIAACAILARQANPDAASVIRGAHGCALLVQIAAEAATTAECDQVLATLDALANEVRAWRAAVAGR
jgi:hypothetical protein